MPRFWEIRVFDSLEEQSHCLVPHHRMSETQVLDAARSIVAKSLCDDKIIRCYLNIRKGGPPRLTLLDERRVSPHPEWTLGENPHVTIRIVDKP